MTWASRPKKNKNLQHLKTTTCTFNSDFINPAFLPNLESRSSLSSLSTRIILMTRGYASAPCTLRKALQILAVRRRRNETCRA